MTSDEIIRIAKAVGLGEVDEDGDIWCSDGFYTEEIDSFAQLVATATAKRKWQGLTEDEIVQLMFKCEVIVTGPTQFNFARAIEAKLKEKNVSL
jgi:hypothetical protein